MNSNPTFYHIRTLKFIVISLGNLAFRLLIPRFHSRRVSKNTFFDTFEDQYVLPNPVVRYLQRKYGSRQYVRIFTILSNHFCVRNSRYSLVDG